MVAMYLIFSMQALVLTYIPIMVVFGHTSFLAVESMLCDLAGGPSRERRRREKENTC